MVTSCNRVPITSDQLLCVRSALGGYVRGRLNQMGIAAVPMPAPLEQALDALTDAQAIDELGHVYPGGIARFVSQCESPQGRARQLKRINRELAAAGL